MLKDTISVININVYKMADIYSAAKFYQGKFFNAWRCRSVDIMKVYAYLGVFLKFQREYSLHVVLKRLV